MRIIRPATGIMLCALLATTAMAQAPVVKRADAMLDEAQSAMMEDPKKTLRLVARAQAELAKADASSAQELITVALWTESEALGRLGELDRAQPLAEEALKRVKRVRPNSALHGNILNTRGSIALEQNDMQSAFNNFRLAHDLYERLGDVRERAIALQNIGTIYSFAGDQKRVLRYYAQSSELYKGDAEFNNVAFNNIGGAYKELGQLERADAEYRRALALSRTTGNPVLEARVLTNIASVALLRGRLAEAERSADRGLRLTRAAEAAEWAPYLWGVKAQIAQRRGDLAGAVSLFERTFQGQNLAATNFYFRDFHESASEAYRAAARPDLAFRHLQALKRLDDEARAIRSSANAALSAAQFDFSNQELKIARLQQDELKARARQQTIMLGGVLLLLAITMAAFLWVRRSRNETRAANRELETSNGALDKALRAKSEFLATTSHEIRTPLNGILGMTQLLLRRRELKGKVRDQVRLIDTAGNTMKAIVDDILDMAQIEQGRVELDRTDVDLPDLMDGIAGLWRAAAEEKGLALVLDAADAPPLILEDERKLRQITFNLLSNAIKFTAQGSVVVTVSTREDGEGERLLIAIRDTGIGVAPDQLAPIFEPFRQADGGTTRQYGGTGLGLAISSKLAQAMGGDVTATSEVGVGSCFTLSLPLRRAAPPVAPERPNGRAATLTDAAVTLIEPNPLFAAMIETCLADARSAAAVDEVAEAPADADVVLLGDDATAEDVAALRARSPDALLVVFGDGAGVAGVVDGVIARSMPPFHLAAEVEALLTATTAEPIGVAA